MALKMPCYLIYNVNMKRIFQTILILVFFSYPLISTAQYAEGNLDIEKILKKKSIRILVTDSGIGGLSVMSDIAQKLEESGSFKKVELIFANALFDAESGYNSLHSRDEKILMFDKALKGMNSTYRPDLIFVACNTLSVLIGDTPFAKEKSAPPVIGIIEPGVKMIKENLTHNKASSVIILGTETTIEESRHKSLLVNSGIEEKRIINKACPQLQSYIEQNPVGEETSMLISFYISEALADLDSQDQTVYLSLNCTHFGYSSELWKKALSDSGITKGELLNPNDIMGDILITTSNSNRFSDPDISLTIVSKVKLANVHSMINIFDKQSPAMVKALQNYQLLTDLF